MSVLAELSIAPHGKGESVSAYVARAVRVLRESGLPCALNPMGTCIEGEWDEVMDAVSRCYRELEPDCGRIYLVLKVDCRKGATDRLHGKVQSVEDKLTG